MRFRTPFFQGGFLAAILAATLQFVLFAAVLSAPTGPAGSSPAICVQHGGQGPAHQRDACLLCPVCLTAALPASLTSPGPTVAPPRFAGNTVLERAPARAAAPARTVDSAFPRGPPALPMMNSPMQA